MSQHPNQTEDVRQTVSVPAPFACDLLRFGLSFSVPFNQAGILSPLLKPPLLHTLELRGEQVAIQFSQSIYILHILLVSGSPLRTNKLAMPLRALVANALSHAREAMGWYGQSALSTLPI